MFHRFIGRIANDNPHGDGFGVPTDWRRYSVTVDRGLGNQRYDNCISISNDAHEVVLSTYEINGVGDVHSHTIWLFRREVFLRFALWYLWQRTWGEWFGLRCKLFYWWLTRDIERWQRKHPVLTPDDKAAAAMKHERTAIRKQRAVMEHLKREIEDGLADEADE